MVLSNAISSIKILYSDMNRMLIVALVEYVLKSYFNLKILMDLIDKERAISMKSLSKIFNTAFRNILHKELRHTKLEFGNTLVAKEQLHLITTSNTHIFT